MNYTKPPLTIAAQADLLLDRGLQADRAVLIQRLDMVNYYRLSGYLFPFRLANDRLREGTTLDAVWRRYTFDRHLRIHIMDAIERIEVAVRTRLIYDHAHAHGAFGYTTAKTLPKLTMNDHAQWLGKLDHELHRSQERFVEHFRRKYGKTHHYLPVWMVAELMSFGHLLTMFRGVSAQHKRSIAARFNIPDVVLWSWLRSLNAVRNMCAHHGRLWNRVLGYKPLMPFKRKHPEWYAPVRIGNDRVFAVLTICQYLMRSVAPQSRWPQRLQALLQRYPDIPQQSMGFPADWQHSPLWQTVSEPQVTHAHT